MKEYCNSLKVKNQKSCDEKDLSPWPGIPFFPDENIISCSRRSGSNIPYRQSKDLLKTFSYPRRKIFTSETLIQILLIRSWSRKSSLKAVLREGNLDLATPGGPSTKPRVALEIEQKMELEKEIDKVKKNIGLEKTLSNQCCHSLMLSWSWWPMQERAAQEFKVTNQGHKKVN